MSFARNVTRPGTASVAAASVNELLGKDMGTLTSHDYEKTRLQDVIKMKEKLIEQQMKEISTLKSNVSMLQRNLQTKQSQMDGAQEKASQALGAADANTKELVMIKADKKKLESQVAELMRANAKLKETIASAGAKNPGLAQQLASMQSQVRSAKMAEDKANEELKGMTNQLRAKDKELDRMSKLVDEAKAIATRNGELENRVRELSKQLDASAEENRLLNEVKRLREADIARLNKELMTCKEALSASNAVHADTTSELKATNARYAALELESNRLRDENARVGAVAARVAASEVRAGSKDEGTVSVLQHLEEVKYYQGEVGRLKEKVASLEKQLAVSDELKQQYRTTAERMSMGTGGLTPKISASPLASQAGSDENDQQGGVANGSAVRQLRAAVSLTSNGRSDKSDKLAGDVKPEGRVTRSRSNAATTIAAPDVRKSMMRSRRATDDTNVQDTN